MQNIPQEPAKITSLHAISHAFAGFLRYGKQRGAFADLLIWSGSSLALGLVIGTIKTFFS